MNTASKEDRDLEEHSINPWAFTLANIARPSSSGMNWLDGVLKSFFVAIHSSKYSNN
jgi:hypothetical protein